jgi:hypothetical protein
MWYNVGCKKELVAYPLCLDALGGNLINFTKCGFMQ